MQARRQSAPEVFRLDITAPPQRPARAERRPRHDEHPARTVLVVEDETLSAMAMAETLEQSGFHVSGMAGSETEALQLAAAAPPAFAVVDIKLGHGGNGLNVGRVLTQRGVTVLYASAYGPGFRQEMEDSGGRACLQKPFAVADLPGALEALEQLGRGQAPRAWPPGFHLFVD
ncbi:response regulator [Falsiroseomonas sp.]|uniref:response regulator n=1 Tax=Falsiroseomonas sp. TaxID=2870721 RepID=UPI0035613A61